VISQFHVKVWTGPFHGPRALKAGALLLVFLSMSGTCLAQAPEGVSGDSTATLLGAFWVLAGLLVALIAWEVVDRRSAAGTPPETPLAGEAPTSEVEASGPAEDEDPFKALLRKTAAHEKESAEPVVASPSSPLEGDSATRPPGPTASIASEDPVVSPHLADVEELSPFQRLAQIGSEETGSVLPVPTEARGSAPSSVAPSSGGDWAALLSKVQAEEEPPAPPSPVSPKASEEDPWKKLLGQATPPEAPGALGSKGDEDPWKTLLTKASAETAAPEVAEAPMAASPLPSGPPAPPPRIRLGTPSASLPPAADSPPPGQVDSETGRPRTISLELNREEGRPKAPPPQTEEE